jgi:tetratricopeptide (TPR) repeat protein
MHGDQSGTQVRFEWMMQDSQVDDRQLGEILVYEFYNSLIQEALLLTHDTDQAKNVVSGAIQSAVAKRHSYTGEYPLKIWLLSRVFRKGRGWLWPASSGEMSRELALFFRYVEGLGGKEIAYVLKMRERDVLSLLAQARLWALDGWKLKAPVTPSCEHTHDHARIQSALDGMLKPEEQTALDMLISACEACKRYARSLAIFEDDLRQAAMKAWPPEVTNKEELNQVWEEFSPRLEVGGKNKRFSLSLREFTLGGVIVAVTLLSIWLGGLGSAGNNSQNLQTAPAAGAAGSSASRRSFRSGNNSFNGMGRPYARGDSSDKSQFWEYTPQADTPTPGAASPQASQPGAANPPLGAFLDFSSVAPVDIDLSGVDEWRTSGPISIYKLLQYWGWKEDPQSIIAALKPNSNDETVMPYELVNFVENTTNLKAIYRLGGDAELMQKLLRNGFPVIVETGYDAPKNFGWVGRYIVLQGYESRDDDMLVLWVYPQDGPEIIRPVIFDQAWRAFNYSFLVVYRPGDEAKLSDVLGGYMDNAQSARIAAKKASDEIMTTEGIDRVFAWFNRGSSLAELDDYGGASKAFDEYFNLYKKDLPQDQKPWRMLWYQTRPYWAYYYTGQYQKLIDLAGQTLNSPAVPYLEESYYWRGLAREALGDRKGAIADLLEAVKINPKFEIGMNQLMRLRGQT